MTRPMTTAGSLLLAAFVLSCAGCGPSAAEKADEEKAVAEKAAAERGAAEKAAEEKAAEEKAAAEKAAAEKVAAEKVAAEKVAVEKVAAEKALAEIQKLGGKLDTGRFSGGEVVLQGDQVTDAGLEHLKELTQLRSLYVSSAQVTDAAVNELKKALPNLRITRVRKA